MMDVAGKRVAVLGLGKSGRAACQLLGRQGARVVAFDHAALSAEVVAELESLGAEIHAGGTWRADWKRMDLVVISPGVPVPADLAAAEATGTVVIGELELASWFLRAPICLVGGTNGKSTTTALIGAMAEAQGLRTFVGGNFGTPLAEATLADWDVLVVEISSYQAERVPTLRAKVHALLNITEDHLDRYPSFDAYAEAKGRPFAAQGAGDTAVIPFGDERVERQARRGRASIVTFGDRGSDVEVVEGAIVEHRQHRSLSLANSRLVGRHNQLNLAAAVASARALGIGADAIERAIGSFTGLPHRMSHVTTWKNVAFYDDSKATNVGAAVTAIEGVQEAKVVLIAGGRDKLGDYTPLVEVLRKKGKAIVVMGEAAERIAEAIGAVVPVHHAVSMTDAVARAIALASGGDAVMLSPACSSLDMFRDYHDRGQQFAAAVLAQTRGTP